MPARDITSALTELAKAGKFVAAIAGVLAAERYGLSEMYQLRGRVGRSNRRAYAYLLVPEDTELSEINPQQM